jgi:beta-lactamase regulating signal transducer with metallopeptidase domain
MAASFRQTENQGRSIMMLALLSPLLVKLMLLLLLGLGIDALMRRRAVLMLSTVWNGVLLAVVVLSAGSLLASRWSWEIPADTVLPREDSVAVLASDMRKSLPAVPAQRNPSARQGSSIDSSATGAFPQPFISSATLDWILTVPYGVVASLLLVRLLVAWLGVRALGRDSIPIAEGLWADVLKELQRELAVAMPVRLVQSDRVRVPSALGIRERVVVIPVHLATSDDRGLVYSVLLHELAHFARSDLAWQMLQRLVEAIFWFHPLVWLASRRIAFIRERACDEFVVHALNDVNTYAQALVEIANGARQRQAFVCGLAVVRRGHLERRLNALQESKGDSRLSIGRPIRWSTGGALSLTAIALACVDVTSSSAFQDVARPQSARPGTLVLCHNDFMNADSVLALTPDGKKVAEFTVSKSTRLHGDGRLSPDGARIAFIRTMEAIRPPLREGEIEKPWPFQIVIRKVGDDKPFAGFDITCTNLHLSSWSPDGKKLVAVKVTGRDDKAVFENVLIDATTGKSEPLDLPLGVRVLDWSRDGTKFLVQEFDAKVKKNQLGMVARGEQTILPLCHLRAGEYSMNEARLSPDGKQVIFIDTDPEHDKDIVQKWGWYWSKKPYLLVVATKKRSLLVDFPLNGMAYGVAWSPNGQRVAYTWKQVPIDQLKKGELVVTTETEGFLMVSDSNGKNAQTVFSAKVNNPVNPIVTSIDWR